MNRRLFLKLGGLASSGALPLISIAAWGLTPDLGWRFEPLTETEDVMYTQFFFVDVFAEQPLTGNPLAIVPNAGGLDETTMKRIAGELNQAETTFILPGQKKGADWRLRSFTAVGHEVFGAGHNSLGAWWWLAESGTLPLKEGGNHFVQEIGEHLLPVEIRKEGPRLESVVLTQSPPEFGKICEDKGSLAEALGLAPDALHPSLPAQVVATGAGHLLVPVRNRSFVTQAHPDSQKLAKVLRSVDGEGCYLYCLDPISSASTAHARFFNPTVGIVEDAATGTAAGPLASFLVKRGIAKNGSTVVIEQGYEMSRPSLLRIEVNGRSVRLAGRGMTVIEGKLRIR